VPALKEEPPPEPPLPEGVPLKARPPPIDVVLNKTEFEPFVSAAPPAPTVTV
jgi:hypothetical protein